jgi:hypothetical protein
MAREKPICSRCKSDNVRLDAFAKWDIDRQEWVLWKTYDYSHCMQCEEETRLVWVEVAA